MLTLLEMLEVISYIGMVYIAIIYLKSEGFSLIGSIEVILLAIVVSILASVALSSSFWFGIIIFISVGFGGLKKVP